MRTFLSGMLSDALVEIVLSTLVHKSANSEVTHSACVYTFLSSMLSDALVEIVLSTLIHSCVNTEVMHSACVYIFIRNTFRYLKW